MKKRLLIYFFTIGFLFLFSNSSSAQCSICTRTAQQMGEKPAAGLNGGILYLAGIPFVIMGFIGYKWWKSNNVKGGN
jgi:UPF0716 family protein affecting phage T7 exclusion